MAISPQMKQTRITKPTIAARKPWTDVLKEKLVQNATHQSSMCAQSADRAKSRHNAALQEALECTGCTALEITPSRMKKDIAEEVYITSKYPPYFCNGHSPTEEVSPFDTHSPELDIPTFWSDITYSQQKQYYEKVDANIKKIENSYEKSATEGVVVYAHYQVDCHIRHHYMATQSMLNICRDDHEVEELRLWQWEVAQSDGLALEGHFDWQVGWNWDATNSLDHQYAGWKARERERDAHIVNVDARWAEIQEERRQQRMRTVIFTFRGQPVRVYRYEKSCELSLSDDEIREISEHNAGGHTGWALVAEPLPQ